MYTESELLEVKVPMVFLVAGCFSLPMDGHYYPSPLLKYARPMSTQTTKEGGKKLFST